MFNTCTYLVNQLPSPISHCHLHCSSHGPFSSLCSYSDTLHSTTPHYWNPPQPCLAPTPPTGLVSSMLTFPLHPACALASCIGSLLLISCAIHVPLPLDFSASLTFQVRPPFSHWGCPSHSGWALTTHPGSLQTPSPAHLLAQMLNCLAPLNNFADKTVHEGS